MANKQGSQEAEPEEIVIPEVVGTFEKVEAWFKGLVTQTTETETRTVKRRVPDKRGRLREQPVDLTLITTTIDQGGPKGNFQSRVRLIDGRGIDRVSLAPAVGARATAAADEGGSPLLSIDEMKGTARGRFRLVQTTDKGNNAIVSANLFMDGRVTLEALGVSGVGGFSMTACPGVEISVDIGRPARSQSQHEDHH